MIIKPKVRGFVCITTHPVGCEANVTSQIDYVRAQPPVKGAPKRVLVVGSSTGYGLGSRINAAFGGGADTMGVFLERPPADNRPATAGWYNSVAFEREARKAGLTALHLNADAFADATRARAVEMLKDMGPVDLVVYSLASPKRTHPHSGEAFKSVLKPIGSTYHGKTVDTDRATVGDVTIEAASEQEIQDTINVMGGEDWELWIDALASAGMLAQGCRSVAYTYIGPKLTWPIYRDGTIGRAKEDLERAGRAIDARLGREGGGARVAVMKAVVTQASSAIPVVPLYISLLFKIMKAKGTHEGCIEQTRRLFERFYASDMATDDQGRLRLDDWEMDAAVQAEVDRVWPTLTTDNLRDLTDFSAYQAEFLKLFGFGIDGIDYDADVNPVVAFSPESFVSL
jgi:enoyl-[acyl-carrier protein] reductase/trans-2-enoyl-CoA reductase (NAD+)